MVKKWNITKQDMIYYIFKCIISNGLKINGLTLV